MARKKQSEIDNEILVEVNQHYTDWTNDVDIRRTRHNGWDDIIREYHGYIPSNWPYFSEVIDPIIRTKLIEKNSRLFNAKLRGKVIPREGGDVVKAKIQNAVLDYQWDGANFGGSMLEKWALMDLQTRMFGASFALTYWNTEVCYDKVVYEGNEFKVLDNNDVGVDYTCTHVKNAKWVQVRERVTIEELEEKNKYSPEPVYKNLKELRRMFDKSQGDARSVLYDNTVKSLVGLEDRVGRDSSFPTIDIVTEYRRERWITFVPRFNIILRDIPNPYDHKEIPVVQLRYYPNGSDVYGDSEVEPIISLARAVNATHSAFIDAVNISTNPPIKVANAYEVRTDTLVYGPNAVWFVGSSINNVAEHRTGDQAIASYRTTIPALKQAIDVALGETSQGVSGLDFREADKTATEVMDQARQRQARDQQNQMYLSEALKDQMMFWLSNNQQFLFNDPKQSYKVFRILGRDLIEDLKELGVDSEETPQEALRAIEDAIINSGGKISDTEIKLILDETRLPKYPVVTNPSAKPENMDIRPKLEIDEDNQSARLYVTREDMDSNMILDYVPDVKSMSLGVGAERAQSRARVLELMLNPAVSEKLATEGKSLSVTDLVMKILHGDGETNPEKYIRDLQPNEPAVTSPGGEVANGRNPTNIARQMSAGGIPTGVPGNGMGA